MSSSTYRMNVQNNIAPANSDSDFLALVKPIAVHADRNVIKIASTLAYFNCCTSG